MFESVRPVAPPRAVATEADVDRIEQELDCHLPPDYRAFLTTFGAGILDRETNIWTPSNVIEQTADLRAMYREPDGDERGRLFWYFENAADLLTPQDIDQLVFIGASDDGDDFAILPGDPAHYFEFPRHRDEVGDGGTTMDSFLTYLDPRTRYTPQARRIVEHGVAREDDGRPDGTPYLHPFTPEGYTPLQDDRRWAKRAIVWGHVDDSLVNERLGHWDYGDEPTDIAYYMSRYPLLAQLETLALRNPSTRFEAEERDIPHAELIVPSYDATLEAGPGLGGLTLYVSVPEEQAPALFQWLIAELEAMGSEMPPALRAQVEN